MLLACMLVAFPAIGGSDMTIRIDSVQINPFWEGQALVSLSLTNNTNDNVFVEKKQLELYTFFMLHVDTARHDEFKTNLVIYTPGTNLYPTTHVSDVQILNDDSFLPVNVSDSVGIYTRSFQKSNKSLKTELKEGKPCYVLARGETITIKVEIIFCNGDIATKPNLTPEQQADMYSQLFIDLAYYTRGYTTQKSIWIAAPPGKELNAAILKNWESLPVQ